MKETPEKQDIPQLPQGMKPAQVQTVQMLGVDPELVQDIRDALRTLPHKEADQLLKRLQACQVLNVNLAPPGAPPQG